MAVYWAAQLAGLYYTPVSVQFLRDEVQHILGDCDATALIHHPSQADKIEGAPQRSASTSSSGPICSPRSRKP
jgi:hypothetical protein